MDNGSSQNKNTLTDNIHVKFIRLSKNEGFCKAVNIGIKQAKGNLIAILNNDTEVDPFWIKNIINTFEKIQMLCMLHQR